MSSSRRGARSSVLCLSSKPTLPVITGDIGGTNARLSIWLCDPGNTQHDEIYAETYPTSQYESFETCLSDFLDNPAVKKVAPVRAASLAVAGAVENNRCRMTNIDWVIDGTDIQRRFGFKAAVLNDFEAVGYGILALGPQDLIDINNIPAKPQAPKCVMGPGTGLGAAQLFWDTGLGAYKVVPGEGAHATFAPRGWKQMALAAWVSARLGHVEIEEVACGRGIELIYEFLVSEEYAPEKSAAKGSKKVAPEITAMALEGDPIAAEAVDMFVSIVGAEAGAMALRCLAYGGVYIAGGIMPRVISRVQKTDGLRKGFTNKSGRDTFHGILKKIPLFVITNTKVGILGSREYALRLAEQ